MNKELGHEENFLIKHYAGNVVYTVTGKNHVKRRQLFYFLIKHYAGNVVYCILSQVKLCLTCSTHS
jgi:myosin heavy subunit